MSKAVLSIFPRVQTGITMFLVAQTLITPMTTGSTIQFGKKGKGHVSYKKGEHSNMNKNTWQTSTKGRGKKQKHSNSYWGRENDGQKSIKPWLHKDYEHGGYYSSFYRNTNVNY